MQFTKKQLEKMADQIRLLSWAQGAIFTTGFHLTFNWFTILVIGTFWIIFQDVSLDLLKTSTILKKEGNRELVKIFMLNAALLGIALYVLHLSPKKYQTSA